MKKKKILALSASLRNARWGKGIENLILSIQGIETKDELNKFLDNEAQLHLKAFVDSGRKDKIPFDELLKNLKRNSGGKGLCNSEVGMVAALWGAYHSGCDIEYIPLASHFTTNGKSKDLEILKERVLDSDGLLLVTPVYFGDRSSLASDFIEFIRKDEAITTSLKGKPMAGVVVGAKRNGGQETALIYQIIEMTSLGMLGLGNDTETSSQYGGTLVGGDIGTATEDTYGINSAIGTGRRLANVLNIIQNSEQHFLKEKEKLRVLFLILQDKDDYAKTQVETLISSSKQEITAQIYNATDSEVGRCIACDICPIRVGNDDEYRCIVKRKKDLFVCEHENFIDYDMIVPVVYSPKSRHGLKTAYQSFIERTRYFRRGDYVFSNVVVMPLVYSEIGTTELLNVRMLTSFIRHQTIMTESNVGYIFNDTLLNNDDIYSNWQQALQCARKIIAGRLGNISQTKHLSYKPVGYILSAETDVQDSIAERRRTLHEDREKRRLNDVAKRLER